MAPLTSLPDEPCQLSEPKSGVMLGLWNDRPNMASCFCASVLICGHLVFGIPHRPLQSLSALLQAALGSIGTSVFCKHAQNA